jgi:hypothetical protein
MIEEKDVDTLIKANRDRMAIDILMILSSVALAVLILLEALDISHDYTIVLATVSMAFMGSAMGQNKWVSVSRFQLIQTLERIINRDANALRILAEKKQSSGSITKYT